MRWLCLLSVSTASLFAQTGAPNDAGVSMGHMHLMVADPEAQKKLWVGVLGAQVSGQELRGHQGEAGGAECDVPDR
jgi:catechol-2,3-dioxygenase